MLLSDYKKNLEKNLGLKISYNQIAMVLGCSRQNISQIKNNELSEKNLETLNEYFKKISFEQGLTKVPIFNDAEASAGNGRYIDEAHPDDYICFSKDYLKPYVNSSEKLSLIQTCGDSMSPTIQDKTWLLIDHSQSELKKSGIYVIRIGDELLVKRLQKIPSEKIIKVKSDNPAWEAFNIPYEDFTDFQIVGKVCLKIDNRIE